MRDCNINGDERYVDNTYNSKSTVNNIHTPPTNTYYCKNRKNVETVF